MYLYNSHNVPDCGFFFLADEVFGILLIYANNFCGIFWMDTDQSYLVLNLQRL